MPRSSTSSPFRFAVAAATGLLAASSALASDAQVQLDAHRGLLATAPAMPPAAMTKKPPTPPGEFDKKDYNGKKPSGLCCENFSGNVNACNASKLGCKFKNKTGKCIIEKGVTKRCKQWKKLCNSRNGTRPAKGIPPGQADCNKTTRKSAFGYPRVYPCKWNKSKGKCQIRTAGTKWKKDD